MESGLASRSLRVRQRKEDVKANTREVVVNYGDSHSCVTCMLDPLAKEIRAAGYVIVGPGDLSFPVAGSEVAGFGSLI
jgi:hypothetical protein